jgi:hypothetical protein
LYTHHASMVRPTPGRRSRTVGVGIVSQPRAPVNPADEPAVRRRRQRIKRGSVA